jgi:hypothetical protein
MIYFLRRMMVDASGVVSGRLIEKILPNPEVLRTLILPPCAATISLTIARPRPVPCCFPPERVIGLIEPLEDVRQGFSGNA